MAAIDMLALKNTSEQKRARQEPPNWLKSIPGGWGEKEMNPKKQRQNTSQSHQKAEFVTA